MKTFGIYLAYPPSIRLANEGLGRFLAEFLKAAGGRGDVRFVVACPGWMRESLAELFEHAGVPHGAVEVLSPPGKPGLLILSDWFDRPAKRAAGPRVAPRRSRRLSRIVRGLVPTRLAARCRSRVVVLAVVVAILPVAIIALAMATLVRLAKRAVRAVKRLVRRDRDGAERRSGGRRLREKLARLRHSRSLVESEMRLVHDLVDRRGDVAAWYCPTAFWPEFNGIRAPRLMCVPDFVVSDFPIDFAGVGGDAFLETIRRIERTIAGGDRFVTYSEEVKQGTLVDRFGIDPARVHVVPHGANRLDHVLDRLTDRPGGIDEACRRLLAEAMRKVEPAGARPPVTGGDDPGPFLFYASQVRPNKNLITLFRAVRHLVRRRFIGRRLVLTGSAQAMPQVAATVASLGLEDDVLFLRGLSEEQLAACYRLADLAVNPSLSEGGCPFTFTEAVSVGTPVVMSRIAVTEEVIADETVRRAMLFDPYDWRSVAERIEWGLANRETLLAMQRPVYQMLSKRSWREVVDDHVRILESASASSVRVPLPGRQAG